ncbi:MAG: BtrH N-terminal domain-containing protein [Candidatus Hodarchaeales archaeon]|jgi:hypothetical protein
MSIEMKKSLFKGFIHHPGVHCTSTALRNVLEFNGIKLSEEMVFGLGSGMNIGYLKFPGQNPMIGGRSKDLHTDLSKNLNISLSEFRSKDKDEGWRRLKSYLDKKQPIAINVDLAYLSYQQGLPENYHFGQHAVVICGYDSDKETIQIADTGFEDIKEISLKDLSKARNSSFNKWMDPHNYIFEFNFSNNIPDLKEIIPKAIRKNGKSLQKSSRAMGILGIHSGTKGLEKFSKDLSKWLELSEDDLKNRCEEIHGYISEYGTGGGFFRYLYSRFLKESSEILNDKTLVSLSEYYLKLGDSWEVLSKKFENLSQESTKETLMSEIQDLLISLIKKELIGAKKLENYIYG